MKNILITGGSGFIGSRIADLLKNKHNVICTYYNSPIKIKNVKKRLMVKYVWKKQVKNIIDKLTETKLPLFDTISIETFSKCNGGCSFCPVNKFDDPRSDVLMSESLFKKVLAL